MMSSMKLLFLCCLLGLVSAWDQPREARSCYVKKSVCSADFTEIKYTLENGFAVLSNSLQSISASLQLIVADIQQQTTTTSVPSTSPTTAVPSTTIITPTTELPTTMWSTTTELPPLGSLENPASSCKYIQQDSPSGNYWIQTNISNSSVFVYCDTSQRNCTTFNSTGGWTRIANLDMTDPSQQCPNGFELRIAQLRTCSRGGYGCVSTTFRSYGIEYSRIIGRVIGYQYGTPSAFHENVAIDDVYVDGISLTHGQSPRKHIWTFANALDSSRSDNQVCPCTRPELPYTGTVPSFVGQDYFCESGTGGASAHVYYLDNPLWDGQGCGGTSTCCEFNNPPWFCKQLLQATTDDIELRLCGRAHVAYEKVQLEIAEIYIQ